MRRCLANWVVALVLVLAVGGHWAILQSIAWASMAVRYSKTMPLERALAATFDGEHPCQLCLLVKKGREMQRKQQILKPESKLLLFSETREVPLFPPVLGTLVLLPRSGMPERMERPPHPPPR